MAKVCFLDNDITYKLVAFQLFDEAIAISDLQIDKTNLRVLPTAKRVFQGKQKKSGTSPDPVLAEVIELVSSCAYAISDLDDAVTEELTQLKQFQDIHVGEAALIVATRSQTDFLLLSGDKNCMTQLAAIPEQIYKRLCGRVICLEQIILKLIVVKGFVFVRDRVLPMVSCDKSIQICFGFSSSVREENVIAGLNSYINEIRQQAPNLLADL
ncbi:hypothetical protein HCU40_12730 [Pseudanabaena biceps]|nr:hypothetical protein [Pseudanabaena biceps]